MNAQSAHEIIEGLEQRTDVDVAVVTEAIQLKTHSILGRKIRNEITISSQTLFVYGRSVFFGFVCEFRLQAC
jgi:hypothetical protein